MIYAVAFLIDSKKSFSTDGFMISMLRAALRSRWMASSQRGLGQKKLSLPPIPRLMLLHMVHLFVVNLSFTSLAWHPNSSAFISSRRWS